MSDIGLDGPGLAWAVVLVQTLGFLPLLVAALVVPVAAQRYDLPARLIALLFLVASLPVSLYVLVRDPLPLAALAILFVDHGRNAAVAAANTAIYVVVGILVSRFTARAPAWSLLIAVVAVALSFIPLAVTGFH